MSADLDVVVAQLAARLGFRIDPPMHNRLEHHLRRAAADAGTDVCSFVSDLHLDSTRWNAVLDAVTVRETSFFRDPQQLEAFVQHVLPKLPAPLRVWSAGCSHGQEPYSLAIALAEAGRADATIVATDISPTALTRTAEATYGDRELRGLSEERREEHFVRTSDGWKVREPLRSRVSVQRHNLVTEPPPFPSGTCHVIFCRNVLIYFRPEAIASTLERWFSWLPPGGYMFLGFSESLWQVTDAFALERIGPSFVYRRPGGPPAMAAPAAAGPATARPVPLPPLPPPAPRTAATVPPPLPLPMPPPCGDEVSALLAQGELQMADDEGAAAVVTFRRAAYLHPQDPLTHLHLGLALDSVGATDAANRAFRAARACMGRQDSLADVQGYRSEALLDLLDRKLGRR